MSTRSFFSFGRPPQYFGGSLCSAARCTPGTQSFGYCLSPLGGSALLQSADTFLTQFRVSATKAAFLTVFLLCTSLSLFAQSNWPQKSEQLYQGFTEVISGESLDYLQNLKPPNVALNLKAEIPAAKIQFRTQTIDRMLVEDTISFIWGMALLTSDSSKNCNFELSVNGIKQFDFQPSKMDKNWSILHPSGQELSFVFTHPGENGKDKFGYMFLHIPAADIPESGYLTIQLAASNCVAGEWYMAFQDSIHQEAHVYPLPALLKSEKSVVQPILIEMIHAAPPAEAEIWLGDNKLATEKILPGKSTFTYYIDQILRTQSDTIFIHIKDQYSHIVPVILEPVPHREVHFLPHSHVDVGFTHLQDEVELLQWRNLEEGIELAEKTKDYPENARYKWNVEVLWAVDGYLKQATPAKKQRLIEAIQKGWIGLDAFYATMLTGIQKPEELMQIFAFAHDLEKMTGVPIKSSMTTDVPGAQWGTVTALGENGIKYLNFGPNHMPHMPDLGYQVGHTIKTWGDIPHYWVSPCGKHKVLVWMSSHGYSWFHPWLLGTLEKSKGVAVLKFLGELQDRGYPYDMVQVRYTLGDNSGPDPRMPDFVKFWNEIYITPKLVISTNQEMFEKFEAKYADVLPVFSGDQSGYWEDGVASSAFETALNRNTAEKLVQTEQLWAMHSPETYSAAAFKKAWRYLLLFSEHTWGAYSSKSDPDGQFAMDQWNVKKGYGAEATRLTDSLLQVILSPATQNSQSIQVHNTLSWSRTEVATIPGNWSNLEVTVLDSKQKKVSSQVLQNGELMILAEKVPALSSNKYSIITRKISPAKSVTSKKKKAPLTPIQLSWDNSQGKLTSLRIPGLPFNLVDSLDDLGFNSYWYSGINNNDTVSTTFKDMSLIDAGPIVWKWVATFEAPGSKSFVQTWTYIPSMGRLDLTNTADKSKVTKDENLRFAFPFNVPGARIRMDQQWGLMEPGVNQLPGSNYNFYSTQRWIDFSNAQGGITWMSLDAPIVEYKDMHGQAWAADLKTRPWMTEFPYSTRIFSWVMNNIWFVNYKGYQEGPVSFRYVLLPHKGFDLTSTQQKAISIHQPLLISTEVTAKESHLFSLDGDASIMHTAFQALPNKEGWIIRLWNCSENAATTKLKWKSKVPVEYFHISEARNSERLDPEKEISLGPFEVRTLELRRK